MDAFNTEAMKLALMGVTVIVPSGDNGVAADSQLCNEPSGSTDAENWSVSIDCWTRFLCDLLFLPHIGDYRN